MVEILGIVAAVLLVLCLLLISSVLGYRAMLKEAEQEIENWFKLAKQIEKQTEENTASLHEANEQRIEAIEANTRLTGELAVAKLAKEERNEYKKMLKGIANFFAYERDSIEGVLRKHGDFEAQGEAKPVESEAEE